MDKHTWNLNPHFRESVNEFLARSPNDTDLVAGLLDFGYSPSQIQDMTGKSRDEIRDIMQRHGFKTLKILDMYDEASNEPTN